MRVRQLLDLDVRAAQPSPRRMPRLVGIELGLEVLLLGRNLAGQAALHAQLADEQPDERTR